MNLKKQIKFNASIFSKFDKIPKYGNNGGHQIGSLLHSFVWSSGELRRARVLRWVGRLIDGADSDRVARVGAIATQAALLREAERFEDGAPERRQACDVRVYVCHMRQRR